MLAREQLRQAEDTVLAPEQLPPVAGKALAQLRQAEDKDQLPVRGNKALVCKPLRWVQLQHNKAPVDTDPAEGSNKVVVGMDPRNISERKADSRAPR